MIKTRAGEVVGTRVYLFRELKSAGVPWTRKHITTLEKRGEFPLHFRLGENSVAWVASEVDRWVEARIRSRGSAVAARATENHDPSSTAA